MREFNFKNLPVGMAAVIGSFVRSSWMLSYRKMSIIGLKVNDLNIFDCIADTTPVTDLVLKLATSGYSTEIDAGNAQSGVTVLQSADRDIYQVVFFKSTDVLTTKDFEPFLIFDEYCELIRMLYTTELTITLYLREDNRFTPEEVNKAFLNEVLSGASTVIPMASNNRTSSMVTSSIVDYEVSEDLKITFQGSSSDEQKFLHFLGTTVSSFFADFGNRTL